MRCVSITPLLFLATVLLAQVTCQQSGRSTCPCLRMSKRLLRRENIISYTIQKASVCHIDAIVFKTVQGTFCSDPQKLWVKKAMQFVDEKAAAIKTASRPINSASNTSTELFEFINEESGFSYCPCLKTPENVLRNENIESYKTDKAGVCHIDAIVFKTVNGLTFCANPQNLWVKRVMQFVDEKAATEMTTHPINSISTFKTESILKTTTHWNEQDEPTTSPEIIEFNKMSGRSTCPCLKTSKFVLSKENIISYKLQKAGVCHIDAIVFKTVKGTFCSELQKPWVKKAMQFVDEKAAAIKTTSRPINSASTFKKTSVLKTTSHWNGQDETTTSTELFEIINEVSGFSYCPCLKTSETVLRHEKIESFKIDKAGVCHIDAIVFKTVNGLTFCANPQNLWVKRVMQFVDEKAATEMTTHPINSISTFKTESILKTTTRWIEQDEPTTSPEIIEFKNICLNRV